MNLPPKYIAISRGLQTSAVPRNGRSSLWHVFPNREGFQASSFSPRALSVRFRQSMSQIPSPIKRARTDPDLFSREV